MSTSNGHHHNDHGGEHHHNALRRMAHQNLCPCQEDSNESAPNLRHSNKLYLCFPTTKSHFTLTTFLSCTSAQTSLVDSCTLLREALITMCYSSQRTDLLFIFTFLYFVNAEEVIRLDYKGETQHNVVRHAAAVRGLNTTFGKTASSLLSRAIVSHGGIWSSIDEFTQSVFKEPSLLDWYIADVGTDGDPRSITLQGMFSCVDRGKSSSEPISWHVATSLSKELKTVEGPDGFKRTIVGQASSDDITEQCLTGRHENPDDFIGRRTTVHLDKHRGTGSRFIVPPKGDETSVVGDESVFDRLWRVRSSKDPPTVIVWDEESGVGIVDGLPFESGFKVWPTENLTSARTIDYRVHMIPLAALSAHFGFRLQETRVARGESRTSTLLLLLTVWATGLALLVAVFIVAKTFSDTLVEHSTQMRKEHVDDVVEGMKGWSTGEKVSLCVHLAGVTILAAPVAQAVVEGNIDPRASYEVTSGTSVLYSDSREDLTGDSNNPIAGAVFTSIVWVTVRPLDCGFVTALTLSSVSILIFAMVIAMQVTKKSSETMRRSPHRWCGFSPWKLLGWLWLKRQDKHGGKIHKYKVFVRLRKEPCSILGGDFIEDRVKEIALMGSETWRSRANTHYYRSATRQSDEVTREASRNSVNDFLRRKHNSGCVALLARVKMDDRYRFKATTAHTTPFGDAQPREWEYVRRAVDCKSIEYYRTNGQFPEDYALLLTRLGLLKYAKHIAEVLYCDDSSNCNNYDGDGVKCVIAVPRSQDVVSAINERFVDNKDGYPNISRVDESRMMSLPFEHQQQPENAEVEWLGGLGGQYYKHYAPGNLAIRYCLVDSDDLAVER